MNKVKNLRDIVRYWTEKSKEYSGYSKGRIKRQIRLSFSVNIICDKQDFAGKSHHLLQRMNLGSRDRFIIAKFYNSM